MKNIIIILISVIVGSGSTLLIQRAKSLTKITTLNKIHGVDFGGMKVTDLSTDNLNIAEGEGKLGKFLTVSSKKDPHMYVFFDLQGGYFYQVALHDGNDTTASFIDKNSDGKWDFRDFHNHGVSYLYGRGTGYPDTITTSSNALVRIDERYYEIQGKYGNQYIIRDGKNISIQPDLSGRGFFTIK